MPENKNCKIPDFTPFEIPIPGFSENIHSEQSLLNYSHLTMFSQNLKEIEENVKSINKYTVQLFLTKQQQLNLGGVGFQQLIQNDEDLSKTLLTPIEYVRNASNYLGEGDYVGS